MSIKVQKARDMIFNYHGLYYDLQLNTPILSLCRHSQRFHKLIFLSFKPVDVRNTVYVEFIGILRFDGALYVR